MLLNSLGSGRMAVVMVGCYADKINIAFKADTTYSQKHSGLCFTSLGLTIAEILQLV